MTSFSFTSTVATLTTGYLYRFQALGANSLSLPAHLIAADVTDGLHLLSKGEPSSDPSSKPCWLLSFDQTAQSEAARVRTFLRETPPAGLIVFHPFSVSGGLALAVEPDEAKSRQLVAVLQSLLCAEASDQALGHSGASSHHGDAEEKSADKSITAESFERDCAFVRTQWWHDDRNRLIELLNKEKGANAASQFYVYSEKEVRANISRLRDEVTQVKRVFYAVKANCCKQLLLIAHEMGLGFECVSHNEIKLVLSLFPDLPADRILFTPNFAARTEYEAAYALGVHVNLDNVWPLTAWPEVFRGKEVMIRIDPGQGKGHHAHVRTGGARSKFGVSVDQLTAAKPVIDSLALKVVGLHVHAGSGILEHSNWADTAALLGSLKSNFPHLRYFDLGGGLGVPYRPTEKPLDLKALNQSLQQWRESHPLLADIELWLEPGRYIVATSGVLAASVTQLKHKPGKNFVGINTGMNSLIRPALYESYHHIVNLSRLDTQLSAPSALQLVDVVGPICETGDVLGRDRPLPVATSEGDWILIATAGAYGTAMSSQYNLRPPAEERVLAAQ